MRFTFIHIQRTNFTVSALCQAMEVTRSGYRAWVVREPCLRKQDDRVLAVHVAAVFARSRRTYGSPRIAVELRGRGLDQGLPVGRRRTMLLHSDRGSIYGEAEYIQRLAALGVQRSMSRKTDPWDKAVIESFFSTLHFELLSRLRFKRFEDARRAISE